MGPSLTGELEVRRMLVSKCNSLAQKMQDACLIVRDQDTPHSIDDCVWKKIEELYTLTYHKILGTKPLFCNGEEELPSLEEDGGFEMGREATCGGTGKSPVTAGCHVQIEDIRKRIEEFRGRNLKVAGSPPAYQVAMEMMRKTTQSWERFSLETLETVIELITHAVRVHADEVLREFPSLHRKMIDLLLTLLAEIAVRTHQQVAFFMEMETTNPFTVNAHYLDSQVTKATINLRKKMGKFSVNNLDEYHQRQLASLIAEAGGDMSLMWVADRTGRGENELVSAMAIAQSYFKVSHKRFADNLLMTVDHMMLRGFATRIQQHLLESLQVFEASTEDLMALVREDDGKTRRRELIENAVKRQREGLDRLDRFMSANTSIRVRLRKRTGNTFAGFPDVSGIFSSGRSLDYLKGSLLETILGHGNQAQKAAEDRGMALKEERKERLREKEKMRERDRKEKKKKDRVKQNMDKNASKDNNEKKDKDTDDSQRVKHEVNDAAISSTTMEAHKTDDNAKVSSPVAEFAVAKSPPATVAKSPAPAPAPEERKANENSGKDVTAEFERLKEKLRSVQSSAKDQIQPVEGAHGAPLGLVPGPKAWVRPPPTIRPREDPDPVQESEDDRAKRLRRQRLA
eukprot:GEMP01010628.1.p1 GENE.GEMP01010628.1~~GEMP01010628.1.p1  ORF type:complete len:628 (+),score=147.22 GEMP01010628.1:1254-3137(+)